MKFELKNGKSDVDIKGFKLIGSTVSDLEGKYGYALDDKGEYKIEVMAAGYEKVTSGIFFAEQAEVIKDFKLEKLDPHLTLVGSIRLYFKNEVFFILNTVTLILLFIGFLYSLLVTYLDPLSINILISFCYALVLVINLFGILKNLRKRKGKIVDNNGNPISGLAVRLYNSERQLGVYLTNKNGEFKVNLPSGKYLARFSKNMSEYNYKTNSAWINLNKDGYIKEKIVLDLISPKN